ncbi:MAG: AmmeMemoRadiSam system protein B, partial [Firmicutes bacterium]|nr:AmmeMemoRadiSam system protein B [Bacillota bacterium]
MIAACVCGICAICAAASLTAGAGKRGFAPLPAAGAAGLSEICSASVPPGSADNSSGVLQPGSGNTGSGAVQPGSSHNSSGVLPPASPAADSAPTAPGEAPSASDPPGLRCLFQSPDFTAAVKDAAVFSTDGGLITAGVVPHHLVGQTLISGLLELASENAPGGSFDTAVIVAPNHAGDIADIITSRKNWDFGAGVACDRDMTGAVLGLGREFDIAENDARMEADRSASTMIPFVARYLPGAAVAPALVSRTMSLDDTLNFAGALYDMIRASGKRVLLLCSIDFSHYQDPDKA